MSSEEPSLDELRRKAALEIASEAGGNAHDVVKRAAVYAEFLRGPMVVKLSDSDVEKIRATGPGQIIGIRPDPAGAAETAAEQPNSTAADVAAAGPRG